MQSEVPPPLHEDHTVPSETDPLIESGLQRRKSGALGDFVAAVFALTSVVGIAAFTWTLVLSSNPKALGLFAYHPPLQTLSVVCFVSGIVSLQTTSLDDPVSKKKGLSYHQVWNGLLGFPLIATGGTIMIYNKYSSGARHFTSWHSRFGITTLILITLQALVGGGSIWFGGRAFGGGDRAKAVYKYHRISGYVIVIFLLIAIHLAGGWSGWTVHNTSTIERVVFYTVLPITAILGLSWRVR